MGVFYYPLVLSTLGLLYLTYKYIANVTALRRLGFPIIHIPLIQQNHPIWMVAGPLTRLRLKRWLPRFIFDRLALTVYGHEFQQKDVTFKDYVEPQVRANPSLYGNGKTFAIATSGRLEMWTWDSEFAKELCFRYKDFHQFDMVGVVLGVFGQNVFTTEGATWARHRRIVAGAITERVSSVVWDESVRQARGLLAAVTKLGDTNNVSETTSGTTYQLFDFVKRIAIHVLYAAGMGQPQEFTASPSSKSSEGLPSHIRMSYFDSVRIVNENTSGATIMPTTVLKNWPSFLPGATWLHEVGQAKTDFRNHTQRFFDQEREISSSHADIRNNVMSALLKASDHNEEDPEKGGTQRKGPALSDDELVGNMYVFTAAGFDSTANTLAYALILLTRYPKWQTWLIEEVDALLPEPIDSTTGEPSHYDFQSIFHRSLRAQAVLFETLRLFPIIVHLIKMTKSPQTIQLPSMSHPVTIPENTTIGINLIALHTDPAIWRNLNMTPLERLSANDDEDNILTDEHIFRPSRWINSDGTLFKPQPGTYLPWSTGPRVCPGMKMAQVEFVAVLSTLFSRHRLEAVRGYVRHEAAGEVRHVPESDDALGKRLDAIMEGSSPKLTLEMDLFNVEVDEPGGRGLGLTWVARR